MVEVWDARYPLDRYAVPVSRCFRSHASLLYDELLSNRTDTQVERAPKFISTTGEETYVRAVLSRSPEWYQGLFREHAYSLTRRKGSIDRLYERARGPKHSRIQRPYLLRALEAIKECRDKVVSIDYNRDLPRGVGPRLQSHKRNGRVNGARAEVGDLFSEVKVYHVTQAKFSNHGLMRQLIFDRLTQGYAVEGGVIPPVVLVCEYFGVPYARLEGSVDSDDDSLDHVSRSDNHHSGTDFDDVVPF